MKLNHRISIFVPSTVDGNKPAKRLARRMRQEAVTILVDSEMYFIQG